METERKIYCICGHYGTGKTNVAVSLAMDIKRAYPDRDVTLVDLDIVNPYFRSADNARELSDAGVIPILPDYANSNVDIPVLPPQIAGVFERDGYAVFDVGGDDSGATALGAYRHKLIARGYELWIVVNRCRPYIAKVSDACAMIAEIERSSGLTATGIINNTNLGVETNAGILRDSFAYAAEVCERAGLPLIATTAFSETASLLTEEERARARIRTIRDATKKIF